MGAARMRDHVRIDEPQHVARNHLRRDVARAAGAKAPARGDDPRAELIRRLQEYERYKAAAEGLDEIPRLGRDLSVPRLDAPEARARKLLPDVSLEEVLLSMAEVLRRADMFESHQVTREALSTRERMSEVLERLKQ